MLVTGRGRRNLGETGGSCFRGTTQSQTRGAGHPVAGRRALRTYILDVVEAKWGAPPRVLQGLRGEGLIMAMDEAAKQEETLGSVTGTPSTHCLGPAHPPAGLSSGLSSLELAEDVGVLRRDAGCLQDGHAEGEGAAQAQVVQGGVQGPVQGGLLRAV